MGIVEPGIEEIEYEMAELLLEQEIASFACVSETGAPSVSMMHLAADGLIVYMHTFTYNRKFAAIARDPRVSFTVAHVPLGGVPAWTELRAVQVNGVATVVTDAEEVEHAISLSRQQFGWLKNGMLFESFKNGGAHRQSFFRIDPVDAMWNDNRVHLLWRKLVHFTQDGRHIAALSPYQTVTA